MRDRIHWVWALVLLGFLVRFWFLQQWLASPFFAPIPDGNDRGLYHAMATGMAAGHGFFPAGAFACMPLYPLFLAAIYALCGPNLYAAGLAGILLDVAALGLALALALRLGAGKWAVALAGLAYACYPLAVAYAAVTMPNTLNALLLILFAWLVCRERISLPRRAAAGCAAGVATLGYAGMPLIAAVWSLWRARQDLTARPDPSDPPDRLRVLRRIVLPLLVFWTAWLPPVLPVVIHNSRAEGRFVLFTTHGGMNFYMGNHAGATGRPMQITPGRATAGNLLKDAHAEAERRLHRPLNNAEVSAYWSGEARRFLLGHPGAALGLYLRKFALFWNGQEYDDLRILPVARLTGLAFASPLWPGFGWLAAAGLTGLCLVRRTMGLRTIAWSGLFTLITFFITSRYRLTFLPLLATLGALGLTAIRERWEQRGTAPRRLPAIPLALALVIVLVCAPVPDTKDAIALDRYNTAVHLINVGDYRAALEQTRLGLQAAPDYPDLAFAAGNALIAMDRTAEAAGMYRQTLHVRPDDASAHFNLAVCLEQLGRKPEAMEECRRAAALEPGNPKYEYAALIRLLQESPARDNAASAGLPPRRP